MEAGFDLRTLPVILMGGGAATVMRNVSERDGLCRAFLLEDDNLAYFRRAGKKARFAIGKLLPVWEDD